MSEDASIREHRIVGHGNKLSVQRPGHRQTVGPSRYFCNVSRPPTPPNWVAPSSPGRNRPLVPRVEQLARGVRSAARHIEATVEVPFEGLYRPARAGLGFTLAADDVRQRAAWALLGEWLVAASVEAPCAADGLVATHEWFWAGSGRALGAVPALTVKVDVSSTVELGALMPYLLDPRAAATRREVLNAQSTAHERLARKASGAFYTPGDVAYLMVRRLLSSGGIATQHRWLDPAHGSGVFLRAVLSATYGERGARDRIYGVDLDPLAAETSSFVLTAEDIIRSPEGPAPWERWHQFRRNLVTGDALLIDTSETPDQPTLSFEAADRPLDGYPLGQAEPWRLDSVFPETAETGFTRVVANPPYAPLRRTAATIHIPRLHPTTGRSASRDISPVFVELCADMLADGGALAAVIPLSAVASTRSPFPDLRQHLAEQPGRLVLFSFDRAPDALFGDDIKTRNAIIHLDKGAPRGLVASPLYRWTSRTRDTALADIPVTSIADLDGVPRSIPKIGVEWERDLFVACCDQPTYLDRWYTNRRLAPLTSLTTSVRDEPSDAVALAPTAYNFLGLVRDPYHAVTEGHNSQHGYWILQFASELLASAAYALLSSRLAFWIWHITGDGFHVTSSLHQRVPVPSGDSERISRLADLGDQLWKAAIQNPQVSTNRSRATVAYPTWHHTDLIGEIDAEVGTFIGMRYAESLAAWHEQLIIVDADSERRDLIRRKSE